MTIQDFTFFFFQGSKLNHVQFSKTNLCVFFFFFPQDVHLQKPLQNTDFLCLKIFSSKVEKCIKNNTILK